MKQMDRRTWLIVGAAVCVCLFFLDRFVITPLATRWEVQSKRITELHAMIEEAEILTDRKAMLEKRWNAMNENDLPETQADAENRVLKTVHDWVEVSGVHVTALKPHWDNDAQDVACLECRASLTGSMQQLVRFIYALETDPLALIVVELSLNSNDELGRTLGMDIYFSGIVLKEHWDDV